MSQTSHGYDYAITDYQFRITAEKQKEAGRIAQEFLGLKGGPNLYDAFSQYNSSLRYDNERDIVGIGLREDAHQSDGLDDLLKTLSSCIEEGYIQFKNDDGEVWRLVFLAGTVHKTVPSLVWPILEPSEQQGLSEALLRESQKLEAVAENIGAIAKNTSKLPSDSGWFFANMLSLLSYARKELWSLAKEISANEERDRS